MTNKTYLIWTKLLSRALKAFPGLAEWHFFVFGNAGNLLAISPGLKQKLGIPTDYIPHMNIFQLLDIPDNKDIADVFKGLLTGNSIVALLDAEGKKLPMKIEIEKGQIGNEDVFLGLAFPVIEEDTSVQKAAEEVVPISEKAFDITNDGLLRWEKNSEEFDVNIHYYGILGYEPLAFKPSYLHMLGIVHPDDRKRVEKDFENLWNGSSLFVHCDTRLRNKNDEYVWVLIRAKVVKWEHDNSPSEVLAVFSDITGHKNIEQSLRESEGQFRRLSNIPFEGIFIYDTKGVILETNTEMTRLLDCSRSDIIGKQILSFFSDEFHYLIIDKIMNRDFKPIEIMIKKSDNSTLPVEVLISSYIFEGHKASYVGVRPVSDRKKVEMELLEAKIKAEESDNLKSAFLSNMSHEIRTPINGIIGFLEILKDTALNDQERNEYIEIINNRSLMLLKIIDDIIDLSRIQAHQVNITEEECHVGNMLKELYFVFEKQKNSMNKSKVEIKLVFPEADFQQRILTDTTRLQQIITNLVNNALKFTNHGFIEIGYNLNDDAKLEFYVADTGIGIPEEQFDSIFERFRQLETGARKKFSGSGLGLSIAKGLVELLGGEMKVESKLNIGTRIYFTVNYNPAGDNAETVTETNSDILYKWKGRKILLVEDDSVNRKFMQLLLKPTEVDLVTAFNGQQAVDACLADSKINLVLMDLQMPVMNGYEALQEIKFIRPDLPVVAQTGYAMNEEKSKCLEEGFDDYVSKPINKNKLFPIIEKFLQIKKTV